MQIWTQTCRSSYYTVDTQSVEPCVPQSCAGSLLALVEPCEDVAAAVAEAAAAPRLVPRGRLLAKRAGGIVACRLAIGVEASLVGLELPAAVPPHLGAGPLHGGRTAKDGCAPGLADACPLVAHLDVVVAGAVVSAGRALPLLATVLLRIAARGGRLAKGARRSPTHQRAAVALRAPHCGLAEADALAEAHQWTAGPGHLDIVGTRAVATTLSLLELLTLVLLGSARPRRPVCLAENGSAKRLPPGRSCSRHLHVIPTRAVATALPCLELLALVLLGVVGA
eukprot:scaffold2802_cov63-Phaeocystis_antarctica.AAC.3